MRPRLLVSALAVIPALLFAQDDPVRKPMQLEIDGMFGYTAVQVDKWSGFTVVNEESHASGGVAARLLFAYFGNTRFGLEIGTQQLFTYTIEGSTGGTIVTRENTVAGVHVLAIARAVDAGRFALDLGGGFLILDDVTVPGLLGAVHYAIIDRPRFRLPVGGRLTLILNEAAAAATGQLTTGVVIPFR